MTRPRVALTAFTLALAALLWMAQCAPIALLGWGSAGLREFAATPPRIAAPLAFALASTIVPRIRRIPRGWRSFLTITAPPVVFELVAASGSPGEAWLSGLTFGTLWVTVPTSVAAGLLSLHVAEKALRDKQSEVVRNARTR